MSDPRALERLRWEAHWMAERLLAHADTTPSGGVEGAARAALAAQSAEVPARRGNAYERLVVDPAGPLAALGTRFDLRPVDVDLVVLAGMSEQHEAYSWLLARLHPAGAPWPSVGLAAQLLCRGPAERARFTERLFAGPATKAGLLSVDGEGPLFERTLRLPPGMWWLLAGLTDAFDEAFGADIEAHPEGLDAWLASQACLRARRAIEADHRITVVVAAESAQVALSRAVALASSSGRRAVAARAVGGLDHVGARALELRAAVDARVPLASIAPSETSADAPVTLFQAYPGVCMLAVERGRTRVAGDRAVIEVDVPRLDDLHRRRMWAAVLPELEACSATLAARYTLEPEVAARVADDVRAAAGLAERAPGLDDVAEAVRGRVGVTLSAGVELRRPRAGWDALVLSEDRLAQLEEAVARLEQQVRVLDSWGFLPGRAGARGVRLLLSGPSGTGKTLSAEVIATALGVDLLVVDISRVVSKWIGETEKNLARVFEAAEGAQAVLLFDEADALFGKRTEVSDAHDRYANLETAYLLSRLERFEGMAILSTNLRQNIDQAFLRRLEFIVDYEEPGVVERGSIWRCHVPEAAPLAEDVDLRELAELYPVVGGLIRNAAVAAGFLAAGERGPIHQHHFLRALRREYDKAGRAFPGMPPGRDASGQIRGDHHANAR